MPETSKLQAGQAMTGETEQEAQDGKAKTGKAALERVETRQAADDKAAGDKAKKAVNATVDLTVTFGGVDYKVQVVPKSASGAYGGQLLRTVEVPATAGEKATKKDETIVEFAMEGETWSATINIPTGAQGLTVLGMTFKQISIDVDKGAGAVLPDPTERKRIKEEHRTKARNALTTTTTPAAA